VARAAGFSKQAAQASRRLFWLPSWKAVIARRHLL
jgi:hypothetical protein